MSGQSSTFGITDVTLLYLVHFLGEAGLATPAEGGCGFIPRAQMDLLSAVFQIHSGFMGFHNSKTF